MKIEFLGHAGFCIHTKNFEILVDPWLTSSTLEEPILKSLVPNFKTIDYLIPEPVRGPQDLAPDFILLSHYHTHHSPASDIEYWLQNSKKSITIIGPELHEQFKESYSASFAEKYPTHKFLRFTDDFEFPLDTDVQLRGLTNTSIAHFSYLLQAEGASFLHIADAKVNRVFHDRRMDPIWHKYIGLAPTFLALTVGSLSLRSIDKDGFSYIVENTFMSPVEAAYFTSEIKPRVAAVMGIFNQSIWKGRTEYGFSSSEVENYFRWALQHISKQTDVPVLRPGMVFNFDDLQSPHIMLNFKQ